MKKEPLKLQAYEIIKGNIISCVYAPGTIINEELIREQLNVSRTPIRDALSRLEQEGLVKILPKKGIQITSMSLKELNMLYETRNLLEPYAVQNYGNRIPQSVYLDYYQKYTSFLEDPTQDYSFEEMDDDFHRMLINAADNSYFISIYSSIESQIRRTRVITGKTSADRIRRTMNEHLEIVKAALKTDWPGAADAMRYHLSQSQNSYFNYVLQNEDSLSAMNDFSKLMTD